jgi:hypothetical protein
MLTENDSNINEKVLRIWRTNFHSPRLSRHVEAYDSLAIVRAATGLGACGRHAGTGIVFAQGLARGGANVSSASTSGGNKLESIMRQDDVIEDGGKPHSPRRGRRQEWALCPECPRSHRGQRPLAHGHRMHYGSCLSRRGRWIAVW